MHHPILGELRWGNRCWEGTWTTRDARQLEFSIAGDLAGPAQVLVDPLATTLHTWHDIEGKLQRFLAASVPHWSDVKAEEFHVIGIHFGWADLPEVFVIQLTLDRDEHTLWRVEFENGEPIELGRDD